MRRNPFRDRPRELLGVTPQGQGIYSVAYPTVEDAQREVWGIVGENLRQAMAEASHGGEEAPTPRATPLPSPDELRDYERALPGATERALSMAEGMTRVQLAGVEADAEARRAEAVSIRARDRRELLALFVFPLLALIGLCMACYLALRGALAPSAVAVVFCAFFSYQARRRD